MFFAQGERVVRLRATLGPDPYSGENTRPLWGDPASPPAELVIDRVAFDPGGSTEPITADSDQRVVTQPSIHDPSYADVLPGDRIRRELTGVTYQVEGHPAPWRSPFTGWAPGQIIRLKIVEG